MNDKKMDNTISRIIRSYYPTLTAKEVEICRQITIDMWSLEDIQHDIKNGYL